MSGTSYSLSFLSVSLSLVLFYLCNFRQIEGDRDGSSLPVYIKLHTERSFYNRTDVLLLYNIYEIFYTDVQSRVYKLHVW